MRTLRSEIAKSVATTFAVIAALGGAVGWLIGEWIAKRRYR